MKYVVALAALQDCVAGYRDLGGDHRGGLAGLACDGVFGIAAV
jgi:hypothetical protein